MSLVPKLKIYSTLLGNINPLARILQMSKNQSIGVFLSEEKIKSRVNELANQINKDFQNQEVVIVGVLNGSFVFFTLLMRRPRAVCSHQVLCS